MQFNFVCWLQTLLWEMSKKLDCSTDKSYFKQGNALIRDFESNASLQKTVKMPTKSNTEARCKDDKPLNVVT